MTTATFTRLCARRLELAPNALGVARAFAAAGLDGIALLASTEPSGRRSFVTALPDRESSAVDPTIDDDTPRAIGALADAPRWIGVVPYEARRVLERPSWSAPDTRPAPLITTPKWLRYRAVVTIDHESGEVLVTGDDARAVALLGDAAKAQPRSSQPVELLVRPADAPEAHLERVARARELILDGDLYQVNLARRLDVEARGATLDVFARLSRAAPAEYAAAIALPDGIDVLSTSPELLLHAAVDRDDPRAWPRFSRLATEPIKGTRPRGTDAASDARLAHELDGDEKERAELAMIIDVERSDLARVCTVGSVRIVSPPAVVTHRTVHHRRARIAGWAREGVSRQAVLEAMLPSGSVTGAPKVRAMEVIAELEAHRRGLYTGGYGYVAHDGSMTLAMAIRTLILQRGQGHYFTGGGIVADSDPQRELAETGWKALQLQ